MRLTFGSLFDGIGCFSLALARAGWEPRWLVEKEADCRRVTARHFPGVKQYADVRDVGGHNLEPVDLVVGGFPCQDLSVAGKRAGLAGERSGLWAEFRRVLAEVAPPWCLVENVPGLLSSNGGRDMGTLLWQLGELGYWWAYRCLDAQHFGLAQRRNRVFVVGRLGDRRGEDAGRVRGLPAAVLFEPESLPGHPPPRREAGAGAAPGAAGGARGPGGGGGPAVYGGAWKGERPDCAALTAHPGGSRLDFDSENFVVEAPPVTHALKAEGADASEDGTGRGVPLIAATLTGGTGNAQGCGTVGALSEMTVRRLTPVECLRLQGLPDWWLDVDPPLSDSRKYHLIGNGGPEPVVRWIARRMAAAESGKE